MKNPVLYISGPCRSMETVNLTGSWRRDLDGSNLLPANGFYACDRELQRAQHWFRCIYWIHNIQLMH